MTDDQFDEICRNALAFEPGAESASTWSKIRPSRWGWLPTVPEILSCGCACGLALVMLGLQFGHKPASASEPNPVIHQAMGGSLTGLQASAYQLPDTTALTEMSLSLPAGSGASKQERR
jgi:hypothetical protein